VRRVRRPGGERRRSALASRCATVVALCVAVSTLGGCGSAGRDVAVYQAAGGGMTARLELSPAPAPVMRPVRLSIALTDLRGRPVAGRTVVFDLGMPSMAMVPNQPKVAERGAGVYAATAVLSMAGTWRLTVEIGEPGRQLKIPFTFATD
jgi:hypothetical protein